MTTSDIPPPPAYFPIIGSLQTSNMWNKGPVELIITHCASSNSFFGQPRYVTARMINVRL
jgi:hypothetical protein